MHMSCPVFSTVQVFDCRPVSRGGCIPVGHGVAGRFPCGSLRFGRLRIASRIAAKRWIGRIEELGLKVSFIDAPIPDMVVYTDTDTLNASLGFLQMPDSACQQICKSNRTIGLHQQRQTTRTKRVTITLTTAQTASTATITTTQQ